MPSASSEVSRRPIRHGAWRQHRISSGQWPPEITVPYLGIPRHVSETRRYFTVARFEPEVICGDANFTALDPDRFLFGLISSSMFMAWQRAVGGRIKSDLRFSNTIVWNNLPLPPVAPDVRRRIIDAGKRVLDARGLHPERSLADHYNPLARNPRSSARTGSSTPLSTKPSAPLRR